MGRLTMRIARIGVAIGLLTLLAGVAAAQSPPPFQLLQNVPNPFCPGSEGGSFTTIRFATPQAAHVVLGVWSPDGESVVRTLVNGIISAGYYSVVWDGRNDAGGDLGDGIYPYRLTAVEPASGDTLFEAALAAEVSCAVGVKETTWGLLRRCFLGRPR